MRGMFPTRRKIVPLHSKPGTLLSQVQGSVTLRDLLSLDASKEEAKDTDVISIVEKITTLEETDSAVVFST